MPNCSGEWKDNKETSGWEDKGISSGVTKFLRKTVYVSIHSEPSQEMGISYSLARINKMLLHPVEQGINK